MKVIIQRYIKHCLPKQLVKKTSTYYVPETKRKKNETLGVMVQKVKVNRRVTSQSEFPVNFKTNTPTKEAKTPKIIKRNSSFSNIETLQLKENMSTDVNTCILCYEKEPNAVLMPCGHGGMCYDCCIKMWKNGEVCHLCRETITEVLQVAQDRFKKGTFSIVSATFPLDQKKIDMLKDEIEEKIMNKSESSSKNNSSRSGAQADINISIIDI